MACNHHRTDEVFGSSMILSHTHKNGQRPVATVRGPIEVVGLLSLSLVLCLQGCASRPVQSSFEPAPNDFHGKESIAVLNARGNDAHLNRTERARAIFMLFANYIYPGQSATEIHRVMTDTRWLKEAHVQGIYDLFGFVPIEMSHCSTAFSISLFADNKGQGGWAIYFSLSNDNTTNGCNGPRSASEAIAFLNGDTTLTGRPRLLEFALCSPNGQTGVENIERFSRPRVPVQPSVQLTLAHVINVPKEWRVGADDPGFPDVSPIARYVAGYDIGWWLAVERYRKNIDFDDPSPVIVGGWVDEQAGGGAGYSDARDRIEQLIHTFGKQKVSEYLQQFQREFPDEK
jgi:hypothetical protein